MYKEDKGIIKKQIKYNKDNNNINVFFLKKVATTQLTIQAITLIFATCSVKDEGEYSRMWGGVKE